MAVGFRMPHFYAFAASPYVPQGAVGHPPKSWVEDFNLKNVPNKAILPVIQLDRQAVKAICQNPNYPVLFGYVCVMAWGLQLKYNAKSVWKSRIAIAKKLTSLRSDKLDRATAYNLFCGENAVNGLGPAYFTKLLYFFRPTPDFYIMDQWTGKSVNLLIKKPIVKMSSGKNKIVANTNTGEDYQKFCEVVDSLAWQLGNTGEQIEERLFSRAGRPPAQWREYVNKHFPRNHKEGNRVAVRRGE